MALKKGKKRIRYGAVAPSLFTSTAVYMFATFIYNYIYIHAYTKLSKEPPKHFSLSRNFIPSVSLSLSLITFCVHIISVFMFICLSFLMTLHSKRSYSSISLARTEVSNSICLPLQWILLSALSARHNQWVTSKH